MTLFEIVALYIAVFIIMNILLFFYVVKARISEKVSIGTGESQLMLARTRAHANFIETIIFSIVALFTLAQLGAPAWAIHVVGALTVIGRISHALGMAGKNSLGKGRPAGMVMFLISMLFTVGYILYAIIL